MILKQWYYTKETVDLNVREFLSAEIDAEPEKELSVEETTEIKLKEFIEREVTDAD